MKKVIKKVAALISVLAIVTSFVACGGSGSNAGNASKGQATGKTEGTDKITDVNVCIPTVYDLQDAQKVEDAINKITEERYGIHMILSFVATGNWQQQSNLLLTGSEVDVIASFITPLSTYVKNGQFLALDDYYNNASDAFKALWPIEELKGTSIDGKIYAIPNLRNYGNYFGLNIDEEIAAEFGIQDGQKLTMEDIDQFLRGAHEKYPDRYALAPQGGTTLIGQWSWDGLGDEKYLGVLPDCGQTTTVQNLFDTDDFREFCTWARKWYQDGLIMQDILSNTQPWQTLIGSKKAVSCFDNYAVNKVPGMIRTIVVDAWSASNSYAALSYAVNANTKVPEAAWKAMEILYTDQDVSILLNDGIEGTHYVKNSDGTISFPEGKTAADCGYGMADLYWVTPYSGNAYPLDVNGSSFFGDLKEFNQKTMKSQGFGFSFDTSSVVDQYTACINIMDKYYGALMAGTVDVDSTIEQANKEFEAAGLNDIIAAKQQQLDAYLGKN
ncbi:MAG TPA: ABC transporter substrate-binding protein [Clostridiales bacterium]|nr:ABC transporter substrate-binding protein [Clostridiales bacterium]